jgi:hypothetical protein
MAKYAETVKLAAEARAATKIKKAVTAAKKAEIAATKAAASAATAATAAAHANNQVNSLTKAFNKMKISKSNN